MSSEPGPGGHLAQVLARGLLGLLARQLAHGHEVAGHRALEDLLERAELAALVRAVLAVDLPGLGVRERHAAGLARGQRDRREEGELVAVGVDERQLADAVELRL